MQNERQVRTPDLSNFIPASLLFSHNRQGADSPGWLYSASGDPDKRTVVAGRRRKVGPTPPGGRPRAEAPQRENGGGGGGYSSAGGGLSFPGGRGGRMGLGSIILVIILVCVFFVFQQLSGGDAPDLTSGLPAVEQPVGEETGAGEQPGEAGEALPALDPDLFTSGQIASQPTAAPFASVLNVQPGEPSQAPAAGETKQTWTVMLYQDADDKVLEQDIYLDLNEAEKAGSSGGVNIVTQIDRYNGAYAGDGDWTSAKRYLISQDDSLGRLRSQEVADLGEVNMSAGETLVDFVTWAMENYPADKYALVLSDHGMGWPGGWSDPAPKGRGDPNIPLAAQLGDELYLNELDDALGQIRSQTGLDKFELIGMDACLMAQLEVFTALAEHARYAVASQEVEPALGWAYTDFLNALNKNPAMDGAELGRMIVESYIEGDQRILDRSARAEFLSQGSPMGGLFGQPADVPPAQLARQIGQTSTLSAVDLDKIEALNHNLNQLVYIFQKAKQQILAGSRTYAQNFTSIFSNDVPPSYIDLGNFLEILTQKTSNTEINQAADAVSAAISQAVVAEKHGPKKPGATGIAIFFPNSQLYQNPVTGAESYTAIANRFSEESLWDDFLAFHYTGQQFSAQDTRAVVPEGKAVRAPAAGGITISPITASSGEAAPNQPVTLSADLSGENIGLIYLLAGYYDPQANSIFVADRDYLESAETRQANGVFYPDWGQGDFTLQFDWEPVVFAINDGTKSVPALFKPEDYGRSFEEAVYSVDGVYTIADSGEQVSARLIFINGVLRQVFGFTGASEAGAPHEITPARGDTFTVQETWYDLDSSGQVSNAATQDGGTLTFGDQMFTWEALTAAAGDYVVGFVVEDLDGNQQQSLTKITVK